MPINCFLLNLPFDLCIIAFGQPQLEQIHLSSKRVSPDPNYYLGRLIPSDPAWQR